MAAESKKDESELFPSVRKSKFADYVEDLERTPSGEYGSYGFQLMILNQLATEKATPLYKVSRATEPKNRWVNVLPNEASRVKLSVINNEPHTDYVNASWIKSTLPNVTTQHIATQAPVPHSVDDFWRMIWEYKVPLIVMLTALVEKGRSKADLYWKEDGSELKTGDLTVKLTNPDPSNAENHLVQRVFEVKRGDEKRSVTQLQYKSWPDHGVPSSMDEVVNFFKTYRALKAATEKQNPPVVIHCSAGIGRTGSFVLIDTTLEYLAKSTEKNPSINIFETLKHIRTMRPGAVQTVDQYQFCFKFIDHAINKSLFGIPPPK